MNVWNWICSLFGKKKESPAVSVPIAATGENTETISAPFVNAKKPNLNPSAPIQEDKPVTVHVHGVDISHWQKELNWNQLKAQSADYKFVIMKASDGLQTDPVFQNHAACAMGNGFIPGAYHFFRFGIDPIRQAQNFASCLFWAHKDAQVWPVGWLPPCCDLEWDNTAGAPERYKDGGEIDEAGAKLFLVFLDKIESLSGMIPIIYTSKGFFPGRVSNETLQRFSRYPLWVNDFHAKKEADIRIPLPWKKATIWQYQELKNVKFCMADGMDFNLFLGSLDELNAMTKK